MNEDVFIYRIDNRDIIVSVSRSWEAFAHANAWGSELRPENVVGHLLWDFIQDIETRHLYKELFRRVRAGKPTRSIPFRCDSPQEHRFLKLVECSIYQLSDPLAGYPVFIAYLLECHRF